MKFLFLLIVSVVLAPVGQAADWKIGKFTILSSRVHNANDPVLESKLPPIKVPRSETHISLGSSYQYDHVQGTTRTVSITPLPGNHQQVDVTQTVTSTTTQTSRTPDPYYPELVNGKAPQAAYVQGYVSLKPVTRR